MRDLGGSGSANGSALPRVGEAVSSMIPGKR
jgi:hypothetical protein